MSRLIFLVVMTLMACLPDRQMSIQVSSPDSSIKVILDLTQGFPNYAVEVDGRSVINPSGLGYKFRGQPDLIGPFELLNTSQNTLHETWTPVWGQENAIQSYSNMTRIELREKNSPQRLVNLYFRVFDDGVAFRYEIPEQEGFDSLFITQEMSEFNVSMNGEAWWNEGSYRFDTPEQLYRNTNLNLVDSANTPLTFKTDDLHISIHEANLTDYPGMTLKRDNQDSLSFSSDLVPWPDGDKVKTATPMLSPWRTITIGRSAADLLRSRMILNLNEPNMLSDVSWIKPMKYIGIWWGMHLNKYTWVQGEKHGATTANTKRYIDFASENNIQGVLVEGWNQGWERWGEDDALDLTTPYDDFDIEQITSYAREKGVTLIGHHETTANVASYERQLEDAFAYYEKLGVSAVKTGYVGDIKPAGEYHYGQWMIQHYRRVIQTAARHHISIDVHEPVKSTGIERTWPNMMTREGGRGQEYNAWSEGNPPDHTTILPFTRLLAGPMDYTPGIFDITFDKYKPDNRVQSTLAKQLALMVILYSPLQMAADLPENYERHPAFQFVRDLVTDWDESRILRAEIGEEVAIGRRRGDDWFIGAITNENSREFELPLRLLIQDRMIAECYVDGNAADYESNPTSVLVASYQAGPSDTLSVHLARGGGFAVRLRPLEKRDNNLPMLSHLQADQLK